MELKQQIIDGICDYVMRHCKRIMPLKFFDLETTGLSVTHDRIIQLGLITINPQTRETSKRVIYVNPTIPISEGAFKCHGIPQERVANEPTFRELAEELKKEFSNCYVIGFNSDRFDVLMLSEEFGRLRIEWPTADVVILDTLKIEKYVRPRTLIQLHKEYFNEDFSQEAHDALNDTAATVHVTGAQLANLNVDLVELQNRYEGGVRFVDLDKKLAFNENNDVVFTFGKCQNGRVVENSNYANWLLGQDFTSDTKRIVYRLLAGPRHGVTDYVAATLLMEEWQHYLNFCAANQFEQGPDSVNEYLTVKMHHGDETVS